MRNDFVLEFYRRIFGVIKVYDQNGWIQAQTPGTRDIIVFDESAPRAGKPVGALPHFGFRLIDPQVHNEIDTAAMERVTEAGGETSGHKGEFCPGEPYLFFNSLHANEVEIAFEY